MDGTKTQDCPGCGKSFTPYNNRKNVIFCSYECGVQNAVKRRRETRQAALETVEQSTCPWCRVLFTPTSVRHTFCSQSCRNQAKDQNKRNRVLAARPMRACEICGSEFLALNGNRKKYCSPPCRQQAHQQRTVERNRKDPKKVSEYQRKYRQQNNQSVLKHRLKNWYGLTLDEYNAMLEAQKHLCAICEQPLTRPHIDHKHGPISVVRGILCNGCNTGIGMLQDDPAILHRAASYIERHNAVIAGKARQLPLDATLDAEATERRRILETAETYSLTVPAVLSDAIVTA